MRTHWQMIALGITAVCIGIALTTSGALLHLSASSAVLFSTLFFAGCGAGTQIGGHLTDRASPLRVLAGGCTGVLLASIALPLWSSVGWVLLMRLVLGGWVGIVFVAGARLASQQRKALLMQGLYGGALQGGAGLGVLLLPRLLLLMSWQGALLVWALGSIVPVMCWLMLSEEHHPPSRQHQPASPGLLATLRTPMLWRLGAVHIATFGIGTAIAGWIAFSLSQQYHLPLETAAALGSIYLLAGVVLRPAAGLLLQWSERWMMVLIQIAVVLTIAGILLLSFAPSLPLALGGMLLLAVGMNMPYAAILTLAARVGITSGIGAASGQGAVILLLCLGLVTLPLFIGMGTALGQPFAPSGILLGSLALLAAWNLGKPSSQDGGCTPFRALGRYDDRLNAHPSLTISREDVHE